MCATEDVLDVYHRPHDPKRPVVAPDETSQQLVGETVQPLPPEPGQPERSDYEYVRNGTANLFMLPEPSAGWRYVAVTDRRTAKDFAGVVRWLAEDLYPAAEKPVLVMDNLNTHSLASLYEASPPEQARRIAERVEVHHTPKHGSWLNVAEIEPGVLSRQCPDRRIASMDELLKQSEPWEVERNDRAVGVDWRFTTADARIKLRRLCPAIG
ncbi:MAG: IS630 family transposase [Isosphaera sp.]|nr:IS630 family transposase [Isosphaera sp.]